jgi:hypothetical protein
MKPTCRHCRKTVSGFFEDPPRCRDGTVRYHGACYRAQGLRCDDDCPCGGASDQKVVDNRNRPAPFFSFPGDDVDSSDDEEDNLVLGARRPRPLDPEEETNTQREEREERERRKAAQHEEEGIDMDEMASVRSAMAQVAEPRDRMFNRAYVMAEIREMGLPECESDGPMVLCRPGSTEDVWAQCETCGDCAYVANAQILSHRLAERCAGLFDIPGATFVEDPGTADAKGQLRLSPLTEYESRVLAVQGPMGVGKTYQTVELLRSIVVGTLQLAGDGTLAAKRLRVCCISTRVTFGLAVKEMLADIGDFKLVCGGATFDPSDDLVIIQYESLSKMVDGFTPFDVVVLDEIRSLLGNMGWVHRSGGWVGACFETLLHLIKHPDTRVLLLDADFFLDAAVPTFLREHLGGEDLTVVTCTVRNPGMDRTMVIEDDRGVWLSYLKDAVTGSTGDGESQHSGADSVDREPDDETGVKGMDMDSDDPDDRDGTEPKESDTDIIQEPERRRTAVVCRSKKQAYILEQLAREWRPDIKTVVLTGSTDDDVAVRLGKPDSFLEDVDLFIFTSRLTAGVSITLPFQSLFVQADTNGSSVMDVFQGGGRFRELVCKFVHVLVSSKTGGLPQWHLGSYKAALKSLDAFQQEKREWFAWSWSDVNGANGVPEAVFTPKPLLRLYAFERALTTPLFRSMFCHYSIQKGYKVLMQPADEPVDDGVLADEKKERKGAIEAVAAENLGFFAAAYDRLADFGTATLLAGEVSRLRASPRRTRCDKVFLSQASVLSRFRLDADRPSLDEMKVFFKRDLFQRDGAALSRLQLWSFLMADEQRKDDSGFDETFYDVMDRRKTTSMEQLGDVENAEFHMKSVPKTMELLDELSFVLVEEPFLGGPDLDLTQEQISVTDANCQDVLRLTSELQQSRGGRSQQKNTDLRSARAALGRELGACLSLRIKPAKRQQREGHTVYERQPLVEGPCSVALRAMASRTIWFGEDATDNDDERAPQHIAVAIGPKRAKTRKREKKKKKKKKSVVCGPMQPVVTKKKKKKKKTKKEKKKKKKKKKKNLEILNKIASFFSLASKKKMTKKRKKKASCASIRPRKKAKK